MVAIFSEMNVGKFEQEQTCQPYFEGVNANRDWATISNRCRESSPYTYFFLQGCNMVSSKAVLEVFAGSKLAEKLTPELLLTLEMFPMSENWPVGAESVDRYKMAVSFLSLMTGKMSSAIRNRSTVSEPEFVEVLEECQILWNLHKHCLGM